MSIAVAIKKGRTIALAADSQSNFGGMRFGPDNHAARKIRKVGSSLLATTGCRSLGDDSTDLSLR